MVCVEAGLGLDAALVKVTDEMRLRSEALAEELHLLTLELRAGSSREKALRNLALRTGVEEVNTFASMLIQADRFGTSIGDSLRVFSDELRTKRQLRAEERRRRFRSSCFSRWLSASSRVNARPARAGVHPDIPHPAAIYVRSISGSKGHAHDDQ